MKTLYELLEDCYQLQLKVEELPASEKQTEVAIALDAIKNSLRQIMGYK